MTGQTARGRFAPSPTGRIHLGTAAAALLCWLEVRGRNGTLVLRIEDNDLRRARPELVRPMMDDLEWLGLNWDEGPDVDGPHAPYLQSGRGQLYQAALRDLAQRGLLYACTCSRSALRKRGALGRYDGHCRSAPTPLDPLIDGISTPEGQLRVPKEPLQASIRFRVPEGRLHWEDSFLGPQEEDPASACGDVVVVRRDGVVAYQLAVVVDDGAMGINLVTRGGDLKTSTGRQLALLSALGSPHPEYGHGPMLLGPHGKKLSKSLGDPDISQLRDGGIAPEKLLGQLAYLLGISPSAAPASPEELLKGYRSSAVRCSEIAWRGWLSVED